jgi:hypothetical protein
MSENKQELSFTLTLDDTNAVLAGLSELPAKASYDIINKIKSQATPQLSQQAPVEASPAATEQVLVEG